MVAREARGLAERRKRQQWVPKLQFVGRVGGGHLIFLLYPELE